MRAAIDAARFNGLIMLAQAATEEYFGERKEVGPDLLSRMRDLRICLKSIEEHRK